MTYSMVKCAFFGVLLFSSSTFARSTQKYTAAPTLVTTLDEIGKSFPSASSSMPKNNIQYVIVVSMKDCDGISSGTRNIGKFKYDSSIDDAAGKDMKGPGAIQPSPALSKDPTKFDLDLSSMLTDDNALVMIKFVLGKNSNHVFAVANPLSAVDQSLTDACMIGDLSPDRRSIKLYCKHTPIGITGSFNMVFLADSGAITIIDPKLKNNG